MINRRLTRRCDGVLARLSGEGDDGGMGKCGEMRQTCGVERSPRRKKMHSLLVAGTFVLMVLSPCLVAMRSDSTSEE